MANIGKQGEDIAAEYLIQNGYEILCRNFRCRTGEIDIAAREITAPKTVVVLEVKTRRTLRYGRPCESITDEKQKRVKKTAEVFAFSRNLHAYDFRIDVIEILLTKGEATIEHIKNAF